MQVARILWSCLTIVGVPAIGTFVCAAEPQVVVHVASGRQFEGVIDGTSGNEQLVLRMEHTGITIRRPIRWERVTGASVDGQPVEVATLRARVQGSGFRVQESGISGQKLSPRKIEMRGNTSSPPATDETNPVELPRVTMVTFDAAVANWDADVETDGLLIDVVPLDIDRRLVPVSGTLEVELYAPQRRTLDLAPQSGGATI